MRVFRGPAPLETGFRATTAGELAISTSGDGGLLGLDLEKSEEAEAIDGEARRGRPDFIVLVAVTYSSRSLTAEE